LETGLKSAVTGHIESALADFSEARRIDPNIPITAAQWNALCWSGSVHRQAKLVVDGACETAVTLDPENIDYLDSRGLARALAGRNKEAIADLKRFAEGTTDEARRAQRQNWITALGAGKDPFTEAEMSLLQKEVLSSP
jgi:cytochrome c-type biogenesis protein CcmH/NrfG